MKIIRTIAVVVAAGALVTGIGATSAFAADTPSPTPAVTNHFDCSKASEVKAKLDAAKAKVPEQVQNRITELQSWKQTATDAGMTKLADRIQKRIDRLGGRAEKVTARIDKLEQRIDKKCSAQ